MKTLYILPALFCLILLVSGCELIADIFKAGVWVGIIMVIVVVALIIWLLKKT